MKPLDGLSHWQSSGLGENLSFFLRLNFLLYRRMFFLIISTAVRHDCLPRIKHMFSTIYLSGMSLLEC